MSATPDLSRDQLILFGDSILERSGEVQDGFSFFGALSHTYNRKLDIVNRGASGYTSRMAVKVVDSLVKERYPGKVKLVIVMFGSNDATLTEKWKKDEDPEPVPIDEYKANMKTVISKIKEAGYPVLCVTPGACADKMISNLARTDAQHKAYAEALIQVCSEMDNTPCFNLYKDMHEAAEGHNVRNLVNDGLHLNGHGYRVFYSGLTTLLEQHCSPDNLPTCGKEWRQMM